MYVRKPREAQGSPGKLGLGDRSESGASTRSFFVKLSVAKRGLR